MSSVQAFYDDLAESYHLIFEDWNRSIARQGVALDRILSNRLGLASCHVLDAAAGIGTQALGLAAHAHRVVGSDISVRALERAQREASSRELSVTLVAADFRRLPFHPGSFDALIVCDNALPHLLSLEEIRSALQEMHRCVRPNGIVLLSMRDYASPPVAGTVEYRPYGEREWNGRRFFAEQEWRWNGPTYQVLLRIQAVDEPKPSVEVETTYLATPVSTVLELMSDVGLLDVQRIDDIYYQPVLVGTARRAA